MANSLESRFVPAGFFALRTPLLPFDDLLGWSAGLSAPWALDNGASLDAAIATDKLLLRERLSDIISRPEVREALFVASPDLDERLPVWQQTPDSDASEKMERALVRYFTRMAGRPTPFGLFAGCSVGSVGAATALTLAGLSNYGRHTRLDMDYVVALAQSLARDATVQGELAVHPNSSLYVTPGRICYAEVRRNGKGWTHHNVALARSDYLDATLARAAAGSLPDALARGLIETDPDATREEADEFIDELIQQQVLVPELVPPLTGPEPVPGIALRLHRHSGGIAAERLGQMHAALASLDAQGIGAAPDRYREIAGALKELPVKIEPGRLFQVDMVKPVVGATLGSEVVEEVLRGVTILQRLARPPRDTAIKRFCERFTTRYEAREVPLVEALDHEVGIGFDVADRAELESSSLLEGLTFPQAEEESTRWGKREVALLRKLSRALTLGLREIELEPADIAEMSHPEPLPLPNAFAAIGAVAAASPTALAQGDFRVLLGGASGPSGARLLGRFCHADPVLEESVRSHLRAEEALDPDAVFAEIVHLPESRLGNILARPVLREYEIPYLGRSGVDLERQIPITDLRVSVVGNEVVLRSARLDRRIIPRLTSAHNFEACQGTYKFLCALQGQGTAIALGWDWGPLRDAPHLPRVVAGRMVFSRASWRLCHSELQALGRSRGAARFCAMQELRAARRLPRWVLLADGDNELPVDLDNVLCVETLIELIKAREQATLSELLPAPEELVTTGPEGRFVHEFVIPFLRAAPAKTVASTMRAPDTGSAAMFRTKWSKTRNGQMMANVGQRSFPPGSEWLYAKLYTGQAMADQVLREVVGRAVEDVADRSHSIHRWFFIRYGDPDWHIRARFQGEPEVLQALVLPALKAAAAPFLADGRIWRFQLDTYEREVERYGGEEGMPLAEQLFHADSVAALELLETAEDARADIRWRTAIYSIDRFLNDLGLDLTTRHKVSKRVAAEFASEFRADRKLREQVSDKYRVERKGLQSLLEGADDPAAARSVASILCRRTDRMAPAVAELQRLEQAGRLERPLAELAASFIHMHVNRLLPSAHRAQELVLYEFLKRWYESKIAQLAASTAEKLLPVKQSSVVECG
jgi:thiopeptide-type bacteriocin biosynthesis protein